MPAWREYAGFVDAALRAAGVHSVEMLERADLDALKRMADGVALFWDVISGQ